jgi:MFS family permease
MTTICATCDPLPDTSPDDSAGLAAAASSTAGRHHRRLLLAVMLDALTAGSFLPLLFLYLSTTTALDAADIGLLLSGGGAAGLLLNPVAGTITDRFGAGRTVLLANLVAAAGFLGLLHVGPVAQLVATIAVVTFAQRLYWSAWPVFIAGQTEGGASLDRWFGTVNAAKSGALGVGSAAAAGLLAVGGPQDLPVLLAAAALGSLGCALLLRPALKRHARQASSATTPAGEAMAAGWAAVLRDRRYLRLTASHTALTVAWLMLGLAVPMYLVDALGLPTWMPSAALALNTVLVVILQRQVTNVVAGWRRTRTIALGTGAFLLAFAILPLCAPISGDAVTGPSMPLAAAVVAIAVFAYALGETTVGPAASALAIELSPTALRGRYSALFQTSWTVSSIAGPVAIGLLVDWSPSALWLVMGAVVAAGGLGFLASERDLLPAVGAPEQVS